MDFMFEDEVDEVGSDVEAYCPKCKADTTHVVISKYEDEIRRVQCNACGDVHSFRKPRGDVEEDLPEPIAAKKRAMLKKFTWEEFFAKHGEKEGRPYEFREKYTENVIVTHPKFGRGFVSEILSDSKVEVTFKDARRVLVHNRRDMPGLPLSAEGDGLPSTAGAGKVRAAKDKTGERIRDKAAKTTAKGPEPTSAKEANPSVKPETGKIAGKTAKPLTPGIGKTETKPPKGEVKIAGKPVPAPKALPAASKPSVKPVAAEKAASKPLSKGIKASAVPLAAKDKATKPTTKPMMKPPMIKPMTKPAAKPAPKPAKAGKPAKVVAKAKAGKRTKK